MKNVKLLKLYMEQLQVPSSTKKGMINTKVLKRIFERLLPEILIWSLAICLFHEAFIRVKKLLINFYIN